MSTALDHGRLARHRAGRSALAFARAGYDVAFCYSQGRGGRTVRPCAADRKRQGRGRVCLFRCDVSDAGAGPRPCSKADASGCPCSSTTRASRCTSEVQEYLRLHVLAPSLVRRQRTEGALLLHARGGFGKFLASGAAAASSTSPPCGGRAGGSCEVGVLGVQGGADRALPRRAAKELAPSNIRVNCVAPRVGGYGHDGMPLGGGAGRSSCAGVAARQRAGTPAEAGGGGAASWPKAAVYVTGEVLRVNGGMHI